MSKKTRRAAKARRALLTLSLVLVVAFAAVGGTLAWLTDNTGTVVNTFTSSTINVEIEETGATVSGENATKSFQVIPAVDIFKDPKVTASASANVPYYVFVTVTAANWSENLTYSIDEAWKAVEECTGVYYQAVEAGSTFEDYVLTANTIYVGKELTKEELAVFDTAAPSLTFQAYAIQQYKNSTEEFSPAEAWAQLIGE